MKTEKTNTRGPLAILHVVPSVAPVYGGPSKAALEMAGALARRGHRVSIYCTNSGGTVPPDVPLGIPIAYDGFTITYFPRHLPISYSPSLPLARALWRDVARFDAVHIHGIYQFAVVAAALAARAHGVPYLTRPHGALDPYLRQRHRLRKALYFPLIERPLFNRAAAIIYSADEEQRLAAPTGLVAQPSIVPEGVRLTEYSVLPSPSLFLSHYPELAGRRLLLFLSRLHQKKGLDLLAAAFPLILAATPDVHLVIAGPDDGYEASLRYLLQQNGTIDKVTFTGMVQGELKLALLTAAEIFVLPSYTENFGIAVVEALAAGLPAVISDQINIAGIIQEHDAAVVVPCAAERLAAAVIDLLQHPERRAALARNGPQLVREQFTWDTAAQRLEALYRQIIAQRRSQL